MSIILAYLYYIYVYVAKYIFDIGNVRFTGVCFHNLIMARGIFFTNYVIDKSMFFTHFVMARVKY